MMDIKRVLFQWFINVLIKETSVCAVKNESISNQELVKELHKPIIRTFEKRKVYSPFMENIWGTDLADPQLISKFNK